MALNNTLRLLIVSFYLVASIQLAFSRDISPAPQPESSYAHVPSLSSYSSSISFPPSQSVDSPSPSPAPSASSHHKIKLDILSKISANDVDVKLKTICDYTDTPKLCLSTVLPALRGAKITPENVLLITIKSTNEYAKNALKTAEKLEAQPGTPKEMISVLKDCVGSYKDALDNFENALAAFPEHDIGTMQSMLSAVITDVGDCQDQLKEVAKESQMAGFAEMLTNMTSNSLAIMEHM